MICDKYTSASPPLVYVFLPLGHGKHVDSNLFNEVFTCHVPFSTSSGGTDDENFVVLAFRGIEDKMGEQEDNVCAWVADTMIENCAATRILY